jgi:excisionase family DNA binding protein
MQQEHQLPAKDWCLRVEDVSRVLNISVRKVWRLLAEGLLPRPLKVGARSTRWRESEIQRYMQGL